METFNWPGFFLNWVIDPAKIEPIITPRPPAPEDKNIRFLVEVHGARNLKSNAHMKTLLGSGSSK